MEEFLAQDIIDTRKDLNKIEIDTKQKFIMHKQIQRLLQTDLQIVGEVVKRNTRRKKEVYNTYVFGDNRNGKCGQGNDIPYVPLPVYINKRLKRVENGFHHSIAMDKQKQLWSWGKNYFDQLGQGEDI